MSSIDLNDSSVKYFHIITSEIDMSLPNMDSGDSEIPM
ncbi:Uncharacterised protein [Mycobacteroides abscessus subsp. abscessus]|nr:Uncharacterised protein [Mycobacteroides abscessus subsp. abscessus]